MNILYAIQGTGNGHISRARDIIPLLLQKGNLDILISGTESDVELGFPVKYRFKGLSFVFGKNGGVDLISTYKKAKLKRFYKEIKELPVNEYDLVISDFEPVSSWACRLNNKFCMALSHQAAVLNRRSPHSKKMDPIGRLIFSNYAPATINYGFHFMAYDKKIFTPVIRREIRDAAIFNEGHYTVYLPSYSDNKIIKVLSEINGVEWQVFSKHSNKTYWKKNVIISPINDRAFVKSMVSSEGVLCGAGFETPSEALFLQKKLMVIPMKGQFEQQCNAFSLKKMGVPVLNKLNLSRLKKIGIWVESGKIIPVNFGDNTQEIVDILFSKQYSSYDKYTDEPSVESFSFKSLKNRITGNKRK